MDLRTQITTFIFSLIFGIVFSLIIDLIYRNKLFNIILTFVMVTLSSLIYFIILLNLNNAIIHPYYVLAFIVGYILEFYIKKLIKKIVLLIKR